MNEDRASAMQQIKDEIDQLSESPLYEYRTENNYHAVIGEGSLNANIMFIGEAPGKNEAQKGRPFVGQSGRVLDELLSSINIKREDVYITNIVKDRPPDNRDPRKGEIALYAPFLDRQIDIIQPKVIAPLGRFSMEFVLTRFDAPEKTEKISILHGKKVEVKADYGTVYVVPLFHPAVSLYNVSQKDTLLQDFQTLAEFA